MALHSHFNVEQNQNKILKFAWGVEHTSRIEHVKKEIAEKDSIYFDNKKNNKVIKKIDSFNFIEILGKGGFSEVYLVHDTKHNKFFAVRSINKSHTKNGKDYEYFENLQIIMKNDPYDLFGCSKPIGFIGKKFMIMNVHGPTLEKRIEEFGCLSEKDALLFILRAAHTLYWLENVCELAHGDISPSNFVFNSHSDYPHNTANMQLIDFDSLQHPEFVATNHYGTCMYASPQNNENKPYQYRANDAYALGKTIYYCVTGEKNYTERTKNMYSPIIDKIISSLICYNPDRRATYNSVIAFALYGLRKLS